MKYNPIGINRGLCSLEKLTSQKKKKKKSKVREIGRAHV